MPLSARMVSAYPCRSLFDLLWADSMKFFRKALKQSSGRNWAKNISKRRLP